MKKRLVFICPEERFYNLKQYIRITLHTIYLPEPDVGWHLNVQEYLDNMIAWLERLGEEKPEFLMLDDLKKTEQKMFPKKCQVCLAYVSVNYITDIVAHQGKFCPYLLASSQCIQRSEDALEAGV